MMATGAQAGVIGIKAKKKKAVEAIEEACRGTRVRVQWLGDFYPAGDEYDLVSTVTGKRIPPVKQAAIGNSACDQCRYCTEFCPRFLLGYQVEPLPVMRTLAFTGTGAERFNEWAALCCSCGLCTLSACPGNSTRKRRATTRRLRCGNGISRGPARPTSKFTPCATAATCRAVRQPSAAPFWHRRNAHTRPRAETKRRRPDRPARKSRRHRARRPGRL